jgi:metal-responsive CopG/Arc/MetJ family transcriptional regulator
MKTVQMTLDEELVKAVDEAVRRLRTSRSAFTREALREALRALSVRGLELQHRRGYEAHPVGRGEFSIWDKEQRWGDE